MRVGTLVVALLTGLVLTSAANAQIRPAYPGQSSPHRPSAEEDYLYYLRQIGPCVARSKPDLARAFLATSPNTTDETITFERLFGRKSNVCLRIPWTARFQRAHLRGVVAEGLYHRLAPDVPAEKPPSDATQKRHESRTLNDFGQCYVARNSAEAHRLLISTRLGSQEEADAVVSMAPGFKPCFPTGRKIAIDATEVRMAIAEAMYLATQPPASLKVER